jgi:hypothetical protein
VSSVTVHHGTRPIVLERGAVAVEVGLRPLSITVRRGGVPVLERIEVWTADGVVEDRFIQLTEGVIARERLEPAQRIERVNPVEALEDGVVLEGPAGRVRVAMTGDTEVSIDVELAGAPLRVGASWEGRLGERFTGLGARHGHEFDQSGRKVRLGADRRYTGPDCPPDMLDLGGIPQGDYAPAPWFLSSRGYAAWVDTAGNGTEFDFGGPTSVSVRSAAGPLSLRLALDPTPAARLRRYLRAVDGLPALLPEWGYGHWKSRDVYEHQDDVLDDFHGYRWHGIPLDAIVIDSPW